MTEIKFNSDEFYRLIADKPGLAKYLSVSDKLVVVFAGVELPDRRLGLDADVRDVGPSCKAEMSGLDALGRRTGTAQMPQERAISRASPDPALISSRGLVTMDGTFAREVPRCPKRSCS